MWCKFGHVTFKIRGQPRVEGRLVRLDTDSERDLYFIAEQPAPAPHLARPEGRAASAHMCLSLTQIFRSAHTCLLASSIQTQNAKPWTPTKEECKAPGYMVQWPYLQQTNGYLPASSSASVYLSQYSLFDALGVRFLQFEVLGVRCL